MKLWLQFLITLLEASIVLAAVYFEPSFAVRATLCREAWFDGKPTSWWRDELHRWEIKRGFRRTEFSRKSSHFEQWHDRWFTSSERKYGAESPYARMERMTLVRQLGPQIL